MECFWEDLEQSKKNNKKKLVLKINKNFSNIKNNFNENFFLKAFTYVNIPKSYKSFSFYPCILPKDTVVVKILRTIENCTENIYFLTK